MSDVMAGRILGELAWIRVASTLVITMAECFIILGVAWFIGEARGTASRFREKPGDLVSMESDLSKDDVLRLVLRGALQSGYRIEEIDDVRYRVLLSERGSFWYPELIYAVYVSAGLDSTLIEVAARPKIGGGRRKRNRLYAERFLNMVRVSLLV